MPSKPIVPIQTVGSQSNNRKIVTLRDTHKSARFQAGRPWWGYAEKPAEAGAPWGLVGTPTPGNHENPFGDQWEAPWLPDAKYMSANVETGKLTINYVGMVTEYTQKTTEYYEQCASVAHENKWVAPEFGGHVDGRFRGVVGKYLPQSPRIPQAAMAGDPWVLGQTTEINETLARILRETTYGRSLPFGQPGDMTPPAPVTPVVNDAVTLTGDTLQAMIADAVAKALAVQKKPKPDRIAAAARMRAAKEAKKASLAQAHAA